MSEHVQVELTGSTLHIRLHRPSKRNALTLGMYEALVTALERAGGERAVRAVLLSGSEECFTSGNDVLDFMQHPPTDDSPVSQFLQRLPRLEKPLVAAVAGPAIGVGTTLLLHCDLVYAAENARFKTPFVNLGVVPEAGSSLLLPLAAGHQRAAELLLLGEEIDARRAEQLGFVTRVVPAGSVIDTALQAAARFARLPPQAVRLSKSLMRRAPRAQLEQVMQDEGSLFMERIRSPEAMEALMAFAERREPDFSKFE